MKKIIVFGSSGMAGHMITLYLKSLKKYQIFDISHKNKLTEDSLTCDILDIKQVKNIINEICPDVIINCIGILNDKSNDNTLLTSFVNCFFPRFLQSLSFEKNIKIIHLSTDCVFNGSKGSYNENSLKDETNIYGVSKSLGEITDYDNLTFRTSIIGPELKDGKGLFHWFMKQSGNINGYTNVFWTGVTTLELAKAIDKAIDINLKGLYHLVPDNKISKYSLLNLFKTKFNKADTIILPFDDLFIDKSLINTRTDFDFKVKSYADMISEMNLWMNNHNDLYNQYF